MKKTFFALLFLMITVMLSFAANSSPGSEIVYADQIEISDQTYTNFDFALDPETIEVFHLIKVDAEVEISPGVNLEVKKYYIKNIQNNVLNQGEIIDMKIDLISRLDIGESFKHNLFSIDTSEKTKATYYKYRPRNQINEGLFRLEIGKLI